MLESNGSAILRGVISLEWKTLYETTPCLPIRGTAGAMAVDSEPFPQWRGDLLIASLNARTLLRARIRNDHVAYLESICDREWNPRPYRGP
jgi:hypothetical protein